MKITLKKEPSFEVIYNDQSFGTFTQSGEEWEGLICLRNSSGDRIIVQAESMAEKVFPMFCDSRDVDAICASEGLFDVKASEAT
ncbi:MAG: hypothetical protein HUJ26_18905 [Planctomycetaceae bacterium]|nr:hypothetical protein [Planctomycetaceae bacterium]